MAFAAVCLLATLSFVSADPLWVRTYNGPFDSHDEIHAIGVNDSGDVIVSGKSYVAQDDQEFVTIKYRPDGDTVWLRRFNPGAGLDGPTALAVDHSGSIFVTGYVGDRTSEYGDWMTIKYSAAGESLWAAVHDEGDEDRALSVDVNPAGYGFVTGRAGSANDLDYVVVKYDHNGADAWVFRYNGGYDDGANAVVHDEQGYTYVTGYTSSGGKDFDILTWKLGLGGDSLWATIYAGPAGNSDEGMLAAVDGAGSLVVAGIVRDSANHSDFVTIKYASTGETLWTRCYAGPAGWDDQPTGIAVDGAGCVYLTGGSETDSGSGYNYVTVKYGPDGAQRWAVNYAGPQDRDWPCGIALDQDANVFVSGRSSDSTGGWDIVTIKYDSAGNEQRLERFDMPSLIDEAYVMALSSQGTVFVGGRTDDDSTGIDYLTLAYATVTAVKEPPNVERRAPNRGATIVRGVLFLQGLGTRAVLLDVTGRKVFELHAGANDISRLAPGVYFIRSGPTAASRRPSSAYKVVIQN